MKDNTKRLLNLCFEKGITRVAIGVKHESVPASVTHPWSNGTVFTWSKDQRSANTWPYIWRIVEELKISTGCGGTDSHQFRSGTLDDGLFRHDGSGWVQIDLSKKVD